MTLAQVWGGLHQQHLEWRGSARQGPCCSEYGLYLLLAAALRTIWCGQGLGPCVLWTGMQDPRNESWGLAVLASPLVPSEYRCTLTELES